MKPIIIFSILAIFGFACSNNNSRKTNNSNNTDSISDSTNTITIEEKSDSLTMNEKDISKAKTQPVNDIIDEPTRHVEFPTDNNFNGKKLTCQLDISKKQLDNNPDTVIEAMKEFYNLSERYFPISIADDFAHGISVKYINYPRLTYSLELFETKHATKPWMTVEHSIKKEQNGEFVIE
jgi:hypothetical protein